MDKRTGRATLDNSGLRFRSSNALAVMPERPSLKYSRIHRRDISGISQARTTPTVITRTEMDFRHDIQKESPSTKIYITDSVDRLPSSHYINADHSIKNLVEVIQGSSAAGNNIESSDKKQRGSKMSFLVSICAVFLILGGIGSLLLSFGNNKAVTQQVQALSDAVDKAEDGDTSGGIDVLNEEKIPDSVVRSYSVAPNQPRYIRIKKLGNNPIRILTMSTDQRGAIKTPKSIWDTGWYDGSSVPGDTNGASLIVGHVSGPNEGGVFYNLYRLIEGDEIEIEMGDSRVYAYRVVSKEEVPVGDINMNTYLVSKNVDKQGLTLMTCSGEFNTVTQQYENRLAVFAIRTN